jgi:hypothetical protein
MARSNGPSGNAHRDAGKDDGGLNDSPADQGPRATSSPQGVIR